MEVEHVDQLLDQYSPIVKKQLQALHIYKDYDEYYQIGMIALWEAYSKFDPEKGQFATFAIATVRGRLLRSLSKARQFEEKHEFNEVELLNMETTYTDRTDAELTDLLTPYLDRLSNRERIWIKEALLLGLCTEEMAAKYNVTGHTVRSWKKSVVKKLQDLRGELVGS